MDAGITVDDVEVHLPSLDDVFFALTGHPADDPPAQDEPIDTERIDTELEVAQP